MLSKSNSVTHLTSKQKRRQKRKERTKAYISACKKLETEFTNLLTNRIIHTKLD